MTIPYRVHDSGIAIMIKPPSNYYSIEEHPFKFRYYRVSQKLIMYPVANRIFCGKKTKRRYQI